MDAEFITCKYCGKEMPKVTKWDWRCSCGSNYYNYDGYEIWDEPDELLDDEGEGMPQGCAACGNPLYPDCQYSCNLFDE